MDGIQGQLQRIRLVGLELDQPQSPEPQECSRADDDCEYDPLPGGYAGRRDEAFGRRYGIVFFASLRHKITILFCLKTGAVRGLPKAMNLTGAGYNINSSLQKIRIFYEGMKTGPESHHDRHFPSS